MGEDIGNDRGLFDRAVPASAVRINHPTLHAIRKVRLAHIKRNHLKLTPGRMERLITLPLLGRKPERYPGQRMIGH